MIFEVCKNRSKITKVRHLGGQNEKGASILGGSAAEAVVLGRAFRAVLLVLGQALAEHSTRLAPPSKDGGGGFKGFASCRRPPKIKLNKNNQNYQS